MSRYSDQVNNRITDPVTGSYVDVPVQGATIYVYKTDGSLETLTDDSSLSLANPVATDVNGIFYFNCTDGEHQLDVHFNGSSRYKQVIFVGPQGGGTATDASLVQFTPSGTHAVARTMRDKGRDTVSLRDYGAALNGTTSDDTAWANLFADYPSGGVRVTIEGYCRITAPIAPPSGCSNVTLDFRGGGHIYNPNHGFDFLHPPSTVSGWELDSPSFVTDNGGTGVTPVYFLKNDSSDLKVRSFFGLKGWSGIYNSGAKVAFEGRTELSTLKAGSGVAVLIDASSNEVFTMYDLYAENASGQDCAAGVQVISGGSIIIGGTAVKCGIPLLVAPTDGKTVATLGLWPFFNGDTSASHGAQFTASGSGVIQRVEGVLRVSSNAGDGLRVSVSPHSADLQVRAVQNTGNGINLASGGDQKNSRYRVMAFGNTLSGVLVSNNCSNFSVNVAGGSGDDFGGNARYSVEIGTGCDHFDVNVVGSGDTLGQLSNGSSTSSTKVVTARN
jgi:hypothetical protein